MFNRTQTTQFPPKHNRNITTVASNTDGVILRTGRRLTLPSHMDKVRLSPHVAGNVTRPTEPEKAMTLNRVERALAMMRVYLVECAAQNDWRDHRADELALTIAACLRQKAG